MSRLKCLKQVWAKSEDAPWWPAKTLGGVDADDLEGESPEGGTTVVYYQSYTADFINDESLIKDIKEEDLSDAGIEQRVKEAADEHKEHLRSAILEAREDLKQGVTMNLVEMGEKKEAELKDLEALDELDKQTGEEKGKEDEKSAGTMETSEKPDASKVDDDDDDEDDLMIKAKMDKKKKKEDKKKKKEDKKRKKEKKEKKEKREAQSQEDEHEEEKPRKRKEIQPAAAPTKKAKVDPVEAYQMQEERRRLETGKKRIETDKLYELNEDLENAILTCCLSRQREILAELAHYAPRLDQLKEVGIGKTVVKLINTPLQPLAKVLIQMWKTLIHEPPVSARKPTFSHIEPTQKTQDPQETQETQSLQEPVQGTQDTVSTVATSAAEGAPSQESLPTQDAVDADGEQVAIQKLPEGDYRMGMHNKLVNAFNTKDPEGNTVPLAQHTVLVEHLAREIVSQLEVSYPPDERGKRVQQMSRYRQILTNLEDPKNADFRHRVLSKPSPYDLVKTMSVTEMANPETRKERKETTEYMRDAMRTDYKEPTVTDEFQCGRCKARKTTYFQMQTRSADEPMTTFVTCVNCGHAWKFC